MDRRRAARNALILAAPALLVGAASSSMIPMSEARWLPPGRLHDALSREPVECLAWPKGAAQRKSVGIGRAAFRTPLLLGGQAARAGLSCSSCHRNGRGNSDFLFPSLSGAPGTADVTSSLMSSRRGDNKTNPKPIPDLAGPAGALKVSRGPARALETFIHGLIVEEFDGPEPAPEVLAGLAAYVQAMRPGQCRGDRPIRLADRLEDVERAVALARETSGETRRLMLAAARSGLGAVDERFRVPGLEAEKALLRQADRRLEAIRTQGQDFTAWDRSWPPARQALLRAESRSLFSASRLRRLIGPASS